MRAMSDLIQTSADWLRVTLGVYRISISCNMTRGTNVNTQTVFVESYLHLHNTCLAVCDVFLNIIHMCCQCFQLLFKFLYICFFLRMFTAKCQLLLLS